MQTIRDLLFPRRRPLRWILPLLLLLCMLMVEWRSPGWANRAEGWTVDVRFSLRGPEDPATPIVLVALDEASFQLLGDLTGENIRTWPRSRWALLVDKLAAGRPRIIGLDVVFDTPGWDDGGDAALAEAMTRAGNVVLSSNLERGAGAFGSSLISSPPIAPLAGAAAGVGVGSLPLDADGSIRRLTLLYQWADSLQPSYALVIASLLSGGPIDVPPADIDQSLSLPIRYRGPEGTYHTIPLHQFWFDEVGPDVLGDAVVLVGYTTQLEQDRHLAPFAGISGMPGVEIQAAAVDTLLTGSWLHRPPDWLRLALVVAGGLVALLLSNLRKPGIGLVALFGALTAFAVCSVLLFSFGDYVLPMVPTTLSMLAVGGTALAERMIFAEREKRVMRRRFAGVMSPERLRTVMENWDELLDVERRVKQGAVLFADIRGFTHTTETLMRQDRSPEMVEFLTAYLDAMAQAIFAEGGVIYRMLGDGLLILFGLPEPFPDYALRAVRGAMRMALATEPLQRAWPLRDEAPFRMGIGVNSGLIADAIVGRGRRLDYTVFGDAVNTAARIETHCKDVMDRPTPPGGTVPESVVILLGADLYQEVRDQVMADDTIPPFEARGKSEPVRVVRLLGLRDTRLGPR